MKKFLPVLLLVFLTLGLFVSCICDVPGKKYTVTFETDGGGEIPSQKVVAGGKAVKPVPDPSKEDYNFLGWYSDPEFTTKYEFSNPVRSDITLYAKWDFACLAKGTLIAMADGTQKAIETLKHGDLVKVFDHSTGQISSAPIMDLWHYDEPMGGLMVLHFSNNSDIKIVSDHAFYCKEAKNYVCINAYNACDYIGKHFYNAESNTWETLESVSKSSEKVETYYMATENHLNCIAEGFLNVEDGVYFVICSTFEYDDNMKINQEKKTDDIMKYGLFGYEDFKYLTKEEFISHNLAYLKVSLGKGIIVESDLKLLEDVWTSEKEAIEI